MWSNLLDDKDRIRARIFYKAAFYDRRAHLNIISRYSVVIDFSKDDECITKANVTDNGNGEIIYSTDDYIKSDSEDIFVIYKLQTFLAEKWLDEKFPDWRNHAKYWN